MPLAHREVELSSWRSKTGKTWGIECKGRPLNNTVPGQPSHFASGVLGHSIDYHYGVVLWTSPISLLEMCCPRGIINCCHDVILYIPSIKGVRDLPFSYSRHVCLPWLLVWWRQHRLVIAVDWKEIKQSRKTSGQTLNLSFWICSSEKANQGL